MNHDWRTSNILRGWYVCIRCHMRRQDSFMGTAYTPIERTERFNQQAGVTEITEKPSALTFVGPEPACEPSVRKV